jgi:hypothetical protein
MGYGHRYLMTRLSLQVVYLWRHVSSTAPPFILWWSNLEILFGPLHRSSPFIGELRCQAIQMEHGPYIAERTQNAVYIVRCLWVWMSIFCTCKLASGARNQGEDGGVTWGSQDDGPDCKYRVFFFTLSKHATRRYFRSKMMKFDL